jgi:hypothetical protein
MFGERPPLAQSSADADRRRRLAGLVTAFADVEDNIPIRAAGVVFGLADLVA